MWSDEIEKKIKEGSENYQPAYNDKDWDKMELLLEKHLPHEKKRRRIVLWLLPLLLVGTGLFFLLQQQTDKKTGAEKNNVVSSVPATELNSKETLVTKPTDPAVSQRNANTKNTELPVIDKDDVDENNRQAQPISSRLKNSQKLDSDKIKKTRPQQASGLSQTKSAIHFLEKGNNKKEAVDKNAPPVQTPAVQNNLVASADKQKLSPATAAVSPDTTVTASKDNIVAKQNKQIDSSEIKEPIADNKTNKQKRSSGAKFSLHLSAGPDLSSVGIDKPGKWKLQYGIGASYALSKRLTVRAGFFIGRKIYSADSTEYHASYYPPKLQRIDANCLVYEIPVNLVYNFPAVKKHNWFVAGGLSSYLMKEESYEYFYKNAWGQPLNYSHTYKNENSHIFSVINISGGYKYNFTDRFSLMAEPYVRIPVSGIGSGKVKLNSGGVLFSIGFKPFLKRNQ